MSDAQTESAQQPDAGSPRAGRGPARWLPWLGAAVCAAGAAFAHRGLLTLAPRTSLEVPLSAEVESFFFEPSDTSPLLVLGFVGWMLWRRLPRLRRTLGHAGPPAVTAALGVAGLAVFLWSLRTASYDLQAIALFFEGLAVAHAFGGRPALRIELVPAALLVFAVPIPAPLLNEVVWRFQLWTAEYAGFLLYLIGQPALVSGDQILRSDQVFQIIEACSGLRTVETLAMLSVLMIDLFRRRGLHAALLIAAALPVAFVINGFRALTLIFNPHSDVVAIHNAQGIVMLLGGVLLLYALDGGLERLLPQRPPPRHRRAEGEPRRASLRRAWWVSGAFVAGLVLLSLAVTPWSRRPTPTDPPGSVLPLALEGWKGVERPPDRMFLGLASFAHILNRDYELRGQKVNVFVGVAGLGQRFRSFHSPKTRLPTTGWIVEERRRERRDGRVVEVLQVRRGTRRLLIHHWRQGTGGFWAETVRSFLGLETSPFHRSEVPVVVRLTTPVLASQAGVELAEERLRAWEALLEAPLKQMGAPRGSAAGDGNDFPKYSDLGNGFPRPAGGSWL
ncbi:MAG: exosortase/archaeosortase family protein [Myxococcota bacterium]